MSADCGEEALNGEVVLVVGMAANRCRLLVDE